MRNTFIIFMKELKRVFLDKRTLISLFLPGILIYALYTLMGNIMTSQLFSTTTKDTEYQVVYTNNYSDDTSQEPKLLSYLDASLEAEGRGNTLKSEAIAKEELEAYTVKLKDNEIQLIISFTDNFEQSVLSSETGNNITLLYNGESNASNDLYSLVTSLVQVSYTNYTQNVENGQYVEANVGSKNIISMKVISMILPMVTISLLYSTVISLCPEAIAGEKERGTLASLLLTPIKRGEFAMGKILSLSVLAIISGTVSFLGLILSMPNLMSGLEISIAPLEVLLLFFLVISVVLFFVGMGVLISASANTIKEASGYLGPFSAVFILFGMAPSLFGLTEWYYAFVPILNVATAINSLLTGAGNLPLFFGITVASNLVYVGILILLTTRLFQKERVVLGR